MSTLPRQPSGPRWGLCFSISEHLSKWKEGYSLNRLAESHLKTAIAIVNQAIFELFPDQALPGTVTFKPRSKLDPIPPTAWATHPFLAALTFTASPIAEGTIRSEEDIKRIKLVDLYHFLWVLQLAHQRFPMPPMRAFGCDLDRLIKVFKMVAETVADNAPLPTD